MIDIKKYEGILVANTTPFNEDGSLNKKQFESEINYLINAGVKGFFASGTYGEGPMMSPREYKIYIETLAEINNKRVTIISQIGATNLAQALQQLKYAEAAEIDAVAAIPPFYYPHDENALYDFYKALSEATSLPIFIYNNPTRSGNKITPNLLSKIAKIPGIVGMKDSSSDIKDLMQFRMAVDKDFIILVGDDDYTVCGLLMGAQGAVIVLASLFPKIYIDMFNEFKKGNLEEAVKLQYKAIQVRMIMKKGPYISTYKEVLKLFGREGGFAKKPIRIPTKEEMRNIELGLKNLGYL